MGKLALEITGEPIIGNAGLAAVGELMRISDIDSVCAKRESPTDADIVRLYRDRGTCEQYFAELKSELDLEYSDRNRNGVEELLVSIAWITSFSAWLPPSGSSA
jgi:hypothetical protein